MNNIGYISQIIGPVVDVHFDAAADENALPRIHDSLEIGRGEGKRPLVSINLVSREKRPPVPGRI